MGREIRKVIPNWKHPCTPDGKNYQPMFDRSYIEAITDWIESHNLWIKGEHPDQLEGYGKDCAFYTEYGGTPPDFEYHRPDWKDSEMTWFQVYETVSEGTPVSPPFSTQKELVDYLIINGDFWDQNRRKQGNNFMPCQPWTKRQAERFVYGVGLVPSGISVNGSFKTGIQALSDI